MAAAATASAEPTAAEPMRVMVTGGSGLVGKAIERYVHGEGAKDVAEGETWYFCSSADGDLKCVQ
jgi:GDP-L-fucose synthase